MVLRRKVREGKPVIVLDKKYVRIVYGFTFASFASFVINTGFICRE